jgi:Cu/Ag efflux pump CusA
VDQAAAARYGVGAGEVTDAVQTAFVGSEAGQVLEGQLSFRLVVRYEGDKPSKIEDIARTQIDTPSGAKVALSAIAEIREDRGPNFIMREGVQRRIVVQCNTAGRDLRTVVNDIKQRVASKVQLPQGYRVEYGGQFESEAAASERLGLLSVLVIAGIFLILTTAFGSGRDALIIMLNLPLALVGGVVGVYWSGGVLSVASIIGFITLFGVATRNGIMLVSHIHHLREIEGVSDYRQAVIQGATERVSPILMTAGCRAGAYSHRTRHGQAGKRNSGSDGLGDFGRASVLHRPEHGGGPGGLLPFRPLSALKYVRVARP